MTDKEFAKRLRYMVHRTDMIIAHPRESHPPMLSVDPREVLILADTLDPPRPAPGAAVWYRKIGTVDYFSGVVAIDGSGIFGPTGWSEWNEIEYKPAHILAPGEAAVPRPFLQKVADTLYGCGYPAQAARLGLILNNCMEATE